MGAILYLKKYKLACSMQVYLTRELFWISEKHQERWWNKLLTEEEAIDLEKIDCSRPLDELPPDHIDKVFFLLLEHIILYFAGMVPVNSWQNLVYFHKSILISRLKWLSGSTKNKINLLIWQMRNSDSDICRKYSRFCRKTQTDLL